MAPEIEFRAGVSKTGQLAVPRVLGTVPVPVCVGQVTKKSLEADRSATVFGQPLTTTNATASGDAEMGNDRTEKGGVSGITVLNFLQFKR
jgi:hypothetical protein